MNSRHLMAFVLLTAVMPAFGQKRDSSLYKIDSFPSWVGGYDTRAYWITRNIYEYQDEPLKRPRIPNSNIRMKPVPFWNIDSVYRSYLADMEQKRVNDSISRNRKIKYVPGKIILIPDTTVYGSDFYKFVKKPIKKQIKRKRPSKAKPIKRKRLRKPPIKDEWERVEANTNEEQPCSPYIRKINELEKIISNLKKQLLWKKH